MRSSGYVLTIALCVVAVCALCALAVEAAEPEIQGLTEPYRHINVAATESGVIAELLVEEGDTVTQGRELARLNRESLTALLAIARQGRDSRGRILATQAELKLRQERAENFAAVFARGHARPEELRRAQTDLAIAQAQLQAAEEELAQKQLEYDRIQTQLEQRIVRAPLTGVVVTILKRQGEFVAPNDPTVLTIVQLDPLMAVFTLTLPQASTMQVDQQVTLRLAGADEPVLANVEFLSPVADPESGTVLLKVRVPNKNGTYRSGTRCTLLPHVPKHTSSTAYIP